MNDAYSSLVLFFSYFCLILVSSSK